MFTGFASENTPAIQVWDFFRTFASTTSPRLIFLPDDCAPIQVFRTGATTTSIRVYLPTALIEGKQITIVNQNYGQNSQKIQIYSSDVSGFGTNVNLAIVTLGQGDSITLVYSKQCISYGTGSGYLETGWLSLNRGSSTAANNYSAVVGGDSNTASNSFAFIGGGTNNSINSAYAGIIGGTSNTASGSSAFVGGGTSNTASSSQSVVVGGSGNTANSSNSVVIGGTYGAARSIDGNFVAPASSNPIISATGRTQTATLLLGRQTTDATATVLTSNTSAASTTNQVILPNNSAYYVKGSIIATVTGGGNTKSWDFIATIKRGANAAATSIVGAVILNTIAQDAGAASWVVAVTADTTNGGLAVTVTGQAATTIRWVAKLESTEVTY
jgi:hypothetical protein